MSFNTMTAHVVYASDNRFAEILGVSLISLYENSKDMDDIVVYVLDSGISNDNKRKLLSVSKSYNRREISFIPAKNISDKLAINVSVDRGSLSQYARLFISSCLPNDLERVLYLDCDIIVEKSIYELWNLDLQGNTIGALMDAFSKHYRVNIGLEKDDVMFNSGVMLIDLLKWKTNNIEDKVLSFIVSKNGKIQQGDQGALNAVLSHETYCFEPRFNAVTIFFDFTYSEMILYRKPPRFYSEEEIKNAVKNPTIVHFTTSFLSKRAWMKGCQHQYVEEWMRYKEMSPWKDSELWDDYRPIWKQKGLAVYKMFPSNMAVRIAGVMQVYGRPIVNMIMEKIEGKRQNSERRYSPNGVHDESVSVN